MNSLVLTLRPALMATCLLAMVCGALYPASVWGVAQLLFPHQANGSLLTDPHGIVRGSALLGQNFTRDAYFHPRPSAAGVGYDATASGGSNLGPTSRKLAELLHDRLASYRRANGLPPDAPVPADAVTASASGLDPHISPRNAEHQVARVARARGIPPQRVRELVRQHTVGPGLGFLGNPGVNLPALNLALDQLGSARD